MKLSDLASLLAKVQSIAGDVDVVLHDAASGVETVVTDLAVHLDPTSGNPGSTLTIEHGTAPPLPPPAEPLPQDGGAPA